MLYTVCNQSKVFMSDAIEKSFALNTKYERQLLILVHIFNNLSCDIAVTVSFVSTCISR